MVVHAPFHPDAAPVPNRGEAAHRELLGDVLDDEGSSRTQRWIGWICVLLTVAAVVATWRLL